VVSELIVMIITGSEDSDKTWRTLERSHGGQLFKLVDIVLIRRDNQGMTSFKMNWKKDDHYLDSSNRMAGAFAEAIFGISRTEGRRQLSEAGMDRLFLEEVVQALEPDSSAFLIYIPKESLIDTRTYLDVLEGITGDVYHTTFKPQVEEVLLNREADLKD